MNTETKTETEESLIIDGLLSIAEMFALQLNPQSPLGISVRRAISKTINFKNKKDETR